MPNRNHKFLPRALRKFVIGLGVLLASSATLAIANDGVAEIGAGGLEFTSNALVEMSEEDLRVSLDRIDVRYVFRNRDTQPQTLLVAFPLPAIAADWFNEVPDPRLTAVDPARYLEFTTKVDGNAISTDVERRAEVLSIDVTKTLESAGLPLYPGAADLKTKLVALSSDKLEPLVTLGAVERVGNVLVPRWQYRATYYWRQTFLPDRPVVIEHGYRPIVGGSVPYDKFLEEFSATYCIGDELRAAYAQNKGKADTPGFAWINYILTTAGTWAGPIGKFKLTVEKPSPDSVISMCREGLRKIGPTTYEWTAENYRPLEDLDILVLNR